MDERTEQCGGCRRLLLVPSHAKVIRCAVCGKVTKVRPQDPVRQAKKWVKGIIAQFASNGYQSSSPPSGLLWNGTPLSYGGPSSISRPPSCYPQVRCKKRALLVGITYRGRRYELKGTVNDVNCMKFFLQTKYGFPEDGIVVLTENERDPSRIPTRRNMLAAMHWLVRDCSRGDSLVFHFSGHGSQMIDSKGDEVDGYDETLCPVDYESSGMIVDDDVNDILVRPLPAGVKLHAIVDACHSGTSLDLPFLCRMDRMGYCYWEDHNPPNGNPKGTRGGLAISFSGCDDNQTSADTYALSGGTMTGAMTFAFIQAVENAPGATYGNLLLAMRTAIRDANSNTRITGPIASLIRRVFQCGLTQEPQLCSSEVFEVYRKPFTL